MSASDFDYGGLDFKEIGQLYADGWGWRGIAKRFGVPDHKTLKKHALRRLPNLERRNRAEAQRARRQREATATNRSGKQRPSNWYGGER